MGLVNTAATSNNMRAPFQVIVIPYKIFNDELSVLIGKRTDEGYWQAISGGGEGLESPTEAAKRELLEETSLEGEDWFQLDSMCMLPKHHYSGHECWEKRILVIPEYSFMVYCVEKESPSEEHTELRWCSANEAQSLLKYDSNKIALWEICQRAHL